MASSDFLYLVVGDSFLVDEQVKVISSQIEKGITDGVARQSFYLSDTGIEEIMTQAMTMPFLVGAQIFRIYEADKLKKQDVDTLSHYLETASKKTYLIFQMKNYQIIFLSVEIGLIKVHYMISLVGLEKIIGINLWKKF